MWRQPEPLALDEALRPAHRRVGIEREVWSEHRGARLARDHRHIAQRWVRLDSEALQLRLATQLLEQRRAA